MKKAAIITTCLLCLAQASVAQLRYELELGVSLASDNRPIPTTSPNEVAIGLDWAGGFTMAGGVALPFKQKYLAYLHAGYLQYRASARTGPFIGPGGGEPQAPMYQIIARFTGPSLEMGVTKKWTQYRGLFLAGGMGVKYAYNTERDEYPFLSNAGLRIHGVLDWQLAYEMVTPHNVYLAPTIKLGYATKRSHEWYMKFAYQQGLVPVFQSVSGHFSDLDEHDNPVATYTITPFRKRLSYVSFSGGYTF